MCAQTYNPDSEYNISFNVFNEPIPLSINTIYYVENPGNDELNLLVQLFFKLDLNALLPNDLRRLRYRCCFLSHSKIQADYLYKRIVNRMDDDNPATAEAIDFLRACLHADTGGYLVARQMPKISQKDETIVFDKEEHVVSFPLLDALDTLERARFFY